MGFVEGQHEEWKAKQDADSAFADPNYVIAKESGGESGGEAPAPEAAQADAPVESGAPEGYEEQSAPQ